MINRIEIIQNSPENQYSQKFHWKKITVNDATFELSVEDAAEIMELLEKTAGYRRAKNGADFYNII